MTKEPTTMNDFLAIKSMFFGYSFAGKKTVASQLSKKYGLTVLSVSEAI